MATLSRMLGSGRRLLALLLAVMAVAVVAPGAAFAQGPGDDQYTDPFGALPEEEPSGGDPPPREPSPPPPPESGSGDATAVAPEPTAVAPEAVAGETGTETSGEGELARTGLPADFLALLGLGLVCSGVLLRFGVLSRDGRPTLPFGARGVLHQAPVVPGWDRRRR